MNQLLNGLEDGGPDGPRRTGHMLQRSRKPFQEPDAAFRRQDLVPCGQSSLISEIASLICWMAGCGRQPKAFSLKFRLELPLTGALWGRALLSLRYGGCPLRADLMVLRLAWAAPSLETSTAHRAWSFTGRSGTKGLQKNLVSASLFTASHGLSSSPHCLTSCPNFGKNHIGRKSLETRSFETAPKGMEIAWIKP